MNSRRERLLVLAASAMVSGGLVACSQGAKSEPPVQQSAPPQTVAAPQQAEKKEHVFRGKIEQVDASGKKLTVNGENVEGWMGAMTMIYGADSDAVFQKIKPGDQITAKVYDGDFMTLHDVEIVP